jgi:hypothetical protein
MIHNLHARRIQARLSLILFLPNSSGKQHFSIQLVGYLPNFASQIFGNPVLSADFSYSIGVRMWLRAELFE